MKKILILIGLAVSINSFAATGWTTYVTNNSDSSMTILNPAASKGKNGASWNLGDISSSSVNILPHSTASFYTEETRYFDDDARNKEMAYTLSANSMLFNIIYHTQTAKDSQYSNLEVASVSIQNMADYSKQQYTTPGNYNFNTGCVTVKMTMAANNQLNLDSVDYGDHKDCN